MSKKNPAIYGKRLSSLRKSKGLTLDQLAQAVGASKSHVWALENQPDIMPSGGLLYALAEALDTTMENLLGIRAKGNTTDTEHRLLRTYRSLQRKDRNRLLSIATILRGES